MIHLFINGLAATAGGGLTYLRNVVPHLANTEGVHTSLAVGPELEAEFLGFPNVSVIAARSPSGAAKRFWYEQTVLPGLIRQCGAGVLISAGNFAVRNSPVPQILLSRNSLYTSPDFLGDLHSRRHYRVWLDTRIKAVLASRSISWADCTVAPSHAFAAELRSWTRRRVVSIHHGFDRELFFTGPVPLSDEVQRKLDGAIGAFRLLFVSHYSYYRNFETLLRAMAQLRTRIPGCKLLLTCKLKSGDNPGGYRTDSAAALIKKLDLGETIVQLGKVPYRSLHRLYQAADLYVTPAYTESFAHPLVESMASGLPVIASDIAVHREICGDAARYFPAFSVPGLVDTVTELAANPQLRGEMTAAGRHRASHFSWQKHVAQLLQLASELLDRYGRPCRVTDDAGKISLLEIA